MPIIKSKTIHSTVEKCLEYILDPEKTEELLYTASLNCMTDAKNAYLAMKYNYEHFSGKKYDAPKDKNGKSPVKAIHYIQSFSPDDNVTPESAHRMAKAFARKLFGDDVQVVIATHVDKVHVHSHILVNSYSVTGRKYIDNKATLAKAREYSDRVCLAFGIQPITPNKGKGKGVSYHEWDSKRRGISWKERIRRDIDTLILAVKNIDELLMLMEQNGYTVKRGKYISVKAEGQQRFVRLKTLGEEYTEENISSRILWNDDLGNGSSKAPEPEQYPIRSTYEYAIFTLTEMIALGRKPINKREPALPYLPENGVDVHRLSAQLTIINRDNIHSIGELEGKIERLKGEYEKELQELNTLIAEKNKLDSLIDQAEMYFELTEKDRLTLTERLKLDLGRQIIQANNVNDCSDLYRLISLQREQDKKITALKTKLESCKQQYDVYKDIAGTYRDISDGDYINKLIKEEQQKNTRQKSKKL